LLNVQSKKRYRSLILKKYFYIFTKLSSALLVGPQINKKNSSVKSFHNSSINKKDSGVGPGGDGSNKKNFFKKIFDSITKKVKQIKEEILGNRINTNVNPNHHHTTPQNTVKTPLEIASPSKRRLFDARDKVIENEQDRDILLEKNRKIEDNLKFSN
jgi:hypothetical protein